MIDLTDIWFWVYFIAASVSFSGFCIFVWWWWKIKRATSVYAYMTLLLLAHTFLFSVLVYGRYMLNGELSELESFLRSPLWVSRSLFLFWVTTTIVIHVLNRIYVLNKKKTALKEKRRTSDESSYVNEVLIVDDNAEVLEVMEQGLQIGLPDIIVRTASTVEEGLELFGKHRNINLILTDLYLSSGMDGFSLCYIVKEECPWTIVIAMTGYTDIYEFWNVKAAGFDDYLSKPFPVLELVNTVRTHFYTIERWKGAHYRKQLTERREDAKTVNRGLGECVVHCPDGRTLKGLCGRRVRLHREDGGREPKQNRRSDDPSVVPPDSEDV